MQYHHPACLFVNVVDDAKQKDEFPTFEVHECPFNECHLLGGVDCTSPEASSYSSRGLLIAGNNVKLILGMLLMQVSYALLVFFSGMFIATSGFNNTGAPEEFWLAVEPHSRIDSASGISVLSSVVTVLSNVVSNVPTGADYFWSLLSLLSHM